MAQRNYETKKKWLAKEVAKAVNAGKQWDCETVDFTDPDRSPTCIEVDFPIFSDAADSASGTTVKSVYKASKWWHADLLVC